MTDGNEGHIHIFLNKIKLNAKIIWLVDISLTHPIPRNLRTVEKRLYMD